jgi:hypothetical protein
MGFAQQASHEQELDQDVVCNYVDRRGIKEELQLT